MIDPTTPEAAERARFEAWARGRRVNIARSRFNPDEYAMTPAQLLWDGWMARAALAAQEGGGERVTDGAFRAVFDFAWFLSGQGFNEEIGPSVGTLEYEKLRGAALRDFRAAQEATGNG